MANGEDWKLGPFTVERKSNFTALAAFFISLTTFLFVLNEHIRGSDIDVAPPRYMATFVFDCFPEDVGYGVMYFAVPIRMSNRSIGKYTIDIPNPKVRIHLLDRTYEYRYQRTVEIKTWPGKLTGQYCRKDVANAQENDFFVNGLGMNYLAAENFPLLEQGKSWERMVLLTPVYVEDCDDPGCERKNYINGDGFTEALRANALSSKGSFEIGIELEFDISNRGLFWFVNNWRQPIVKCTQKFDFETPETQAVFIERQYVTRGLVCT
ncbi:MAG: hypothetical protein AB7I79_16300 [Rhizobiaceae bacterium]